MWTCPKCKREFKRTNQGHYCGKAPETAEEYINLQLKETQSHLTEIRRIILNAVPDADEGIAWSMPTYKKAASTISFAACKKQISFYAAIEAIEKYQSELMEFTIRKNAVYFPYSKPLPKELIAKIAKQALNQR